MLETIKEYLVGIGFKVDDSSLQRAKQSMKTTEKILADFATSAVGKFAIATVGITTFFAVAEAGFAKFMSGLADTDMEIQKFSRHMFITQQNAYGIKMAMDAMGAKSLGDLKDIAMIPELRERFLKLRGEANSLMPPKEYETYMRQVRDIQFEFARLKMESTIAFQKVGYYFLKYMHDPIMEFLDKLKSFNSGFIKNMPEYAKNIAAGMSDIFKFTNALVELFKVSGLGELLKAGFSLIMKLGEFVIKTLTIITKLTTALIRLLRGDLQGALNDLDFSKIKMPNFGIGPGGAGYNLGQKIGNHITDAFGMQRNLPMTASRQHYADLIKKIGKQMGASQHDIAAALAAAMQESGLQNLNRGDRDSLGIFQQRPSAGWGSPKQVMTPEYATRNFYKHLMNIQNRSSKSITELDQAVQRSAYPNAYHKWEKQANQMSVSYNNIFHIQSTNPKEAGNEVKIAIQSLNNRNYQPITA